MKKICFLASIFVFIFNISAIELKKNSFASNTLCPTLEKYFHKYGWKKSSCGDSSWQLFGKSVKGKSLIFKTYPLVKSIKYTEHITLVLCGVHGDEITPVKFCFDLVKDLNNRLDEKGMWKNKRYLGSEIIVAPIVNPDGFFKRRPTRTNAHGVDLNRNFPTKDFAKKAILMWKKRYRSTKRKFPGKLAASEPETKFQIYLFKKFKPTKIISIHAPLTMIDYDGPDSFITGGLIGKKANELLISMSEEAKGYRIMNYPFFPGSLGNYAGNERGIPTYTIELPSADNRKSKKYWNLFKKSMQAAIFTSLSVDKYTQNKNTVKKNAKNTINTTN